MTLYGMLIQALLKKKTKSNCKSFDELETFTPFVEAVQQLIFSGNCFFKIKSTDFPKILFYIPKTVSQVKN